MEKKNAIVEFLTDDLKRTALFVTLAGISLVISFFFGKDFPVDPAWVAIILCGTPILYEAVTGLILRHDIKADVLVAVAIVASLIMQEWFAAGEVAFIMELGGLLEDISADRSRAGIERLISMVPSKARLVIDGKDTEVDAESVKVGQTIRILPGDTVPLDGKVVSGHSYVDQSSLTGESVPVAKEEGSEVFSGTVNQMGSFDMEVTCSAEDSSFQRLVDMVESTDAERTRVVKI
ncbi:MAG: cation-translocating P-type ATPase, partial [Candidatus Methanomethylophilus sp.]|nr:cation-translocating P-type ATPase [Methanomethylophilus sp.]